MFKRAIKTRHWDTSGIAAAEVRINSDFLPDMGPKV